MNRFFIYFSLFTCFYLASTSAKAQSVSTPTINPTVYAEDENGEITDTLDTDGKNIDAPIRLAMHVNPQDADGWTANYEWVITKEGETDNYRDLYVTDDVTETEISESGSFSIYCYATFTNGTDSVVYNSEYYTENEINPFKAVVATSHLEMPNAFSPNDDGHNDTYGPKGTQETTSSNATKPRSIVEFHMTIYSRWGQKLYETHDINAGWDGRYNGHPCKQGVYYALVTALGADGTKYKFKKDVNLLRGIVEKDSSTTSGATE